MITAKEAYNLTQKEEKDQIERAKCHVAKNLPFIKKAIKRAIKKNKYFCNVWFTKREGKKLSISYEAMTLAMTSILNETWGYSLNWGQDIDNNLEFKISWKEPKE